MKRRTLLFIFAFIALSILIVGATDAAQAQGTAQVTVHNKTGGLVYVNFFGPQNYYQRLESGKHKLEMEMGKYTYAYWVCNAWQTGSFNLTKFGVAIDLESCATGGQTQTEDAALLTLPQIKINNRTGEAVRIAFRGTKDYTFTAAAGISRFEIQKGKYTFSYWACGAWQNGKLNVTKFGASLDLVCENQSTASSGKTHSGTSASATSELMLKNYSGQPVTVYIVDIGKTYELEGTIKITLPLGDHNYIAWVGDNLPVFGVFRTYVEKSELKFLKDGNIVFNSP
jgi:hypothetical protein